jgi:uncharacterized membrane protein YfhO
MPQWKAFVDGRPVPVHRANLAFRGVALENGTHRVTFVYRLKSWRVALIISSVAFLATVGLGILCWRRCLVLHTRELDAQVE